MRLTATGEKQDDILIVDDDTTVVMTLHKVLSEIGRIRFATSGQQALVMAQEARPGLILLDIELPDISGMAVCAKLKANPETADIPVLFITSHTEQGFEEQVFDAGAADYISKPLNPRVVAARVQTHLDYRRAMQLLGEHANNDGLTGLANRRHFDEQLAKEFKRASRQGQPMTLAMIDIDEFKKFNDHFGHPAGDECIRNVSSALLSSLRRPADFVARYGGEEFALILPETDTDGAEAIMAMLLANVEQLQIKHAPGTTHESVTISIGYSVFIPGHDATPKVSKDTLLETADQALYAAKKNGRNCCARSGQFPA